MLIRITCLLVCAAGLGFTAPLLANDCVVLLHGLWRTEDSMNRMEKLLAEAGFRVANIGYESTESSIGELSEDAVPRGIEVCGRVGITHFVTHSLGGILLRQFLEHNPLPSLGRVVMLGPPNQGSEVIDFYQRFAALEWFAGPAGLQLGTGEASVPRALGPVRFDLGVIAGTRSLNPILSSMLPEQDDGKVSVESTRVEGMNDHMEMPVNHVFMMRNKAVVEQVIHYLRQGEFLRESAVDGGESP